MTNAPVQLSLSSVSGDANPGSVSANLLVTPNDQGRVTFTYSPAHVSTTSVVRITATVGSHSDSFDLTVHPPTGFNQGCSVLPTGSRLAAYTVAGASPFVIGQPALKNVAVTGLLPDGSSPTQDICVSVRMVAGPAGAAIPISPPLKLSDGQAIFDVETPSAAGTYQVEVASGAAVTTVTFTAIDQVAASIELFLASTTIASEGVIGTSNRMQAVVIVKNADGVGIEGYPYSVAVDGDSSVVDPLRATSEGGFDSFDIRQGSILGTRTVTVTDELGNSVTASFDVVGNPDALLFLTANPGSIESGGYVDLQIKALIPVSANDTLRNFYLWSDDPNATIRPNLIIDPVTDLPYDIVVSTTSAAGGTTRVYGSYGDRSTSTIDLPIVDVRKGSIEWIDRGENLLSVRRSDGSQIPAGDQSGTNQSSVAVRFAVNDAYGRPVPYGTPVQLSLTSLTGVSFGEGTTTTTVLAGEPNAQFGTNVVAEVHSGSVAGTFRVKATVDFGGQSVVGLSGPYTVMGGYPNKSRKLDVSGC